ncbi:MAG: MFS transporter, partial [Geminicoccaceae bacterium]|nr:MFS transporter [Geminicoccaceae bacterium]
MWTPPLIRNISILAVCQALFFMANTMLISTSPLVGLKLAPMHALATLPLGFQFLGSMVTALPASYLMRAIG